MAEQTPDVTRESVNLLYKHFTAIGGDAWNELIGLGLDPQTAGNVVANVMLRAAYSVAGSGKIAAGAGDPDAAAFVAAAREMAESVVFMAPPREAPQ